MFGQSQLTLEEARRLACFARTPEEDLHVTLRLAVWTAIRPGRILHYQGDPAGNAYLILSGSVKKTKCRADRTTVTIGEAGRGEWLGIAELVLGATSLTDATVSNACELLSFTRGSFARLLGVGSMQRFFLQEVSRQFYGIHARLEANLPLTRLVRHILNHARQVRSDGTTVFHGTQEQIAEAVGVTRETVNKHLNDLQDRGMVRLSRGMVYVTNDPGLQRIATGE